MNVLSENEDHAPGQFSIKATCCFCSRLEALITLATGVWLQRRAFKRRELHHALRRRLVSLLRNPLEKGAAITSRVESHTGQLREREAKTLWEVAETNAAGGRVTRGGAGAKVRN